MAMHRRSKKTNYKSRKQERPKGAGAGRKCLQWRDHFPWLLIAAEQLVVAQAGSADALLEDRRWVKVWGITGEWLRSQIDYLFPGIAALLDKIKGGKGKWEGSNGLQNRVYKMYYNGTSAGNFLDPVTRCSVSKEHWRANKYREKWEERILRIVSRGVPCKEWRSWGNYA